jgi:hypothetical protein
MVWMIGPLWEGPMVQMIGSLWESPMVSLSVWFLVGAWVWILVGWVV